MSFEANDSNVNPAVPTSGVEEVSQGADSKATSDTRMTIIDIDRGVPSWSVAEHKTRYAGTLDTRRFGEMFWAGANSFMFDRRNARWDAVSELGIGDGRFCVSFGMSISRPNIVVLTFAVLRIISTGSSL